MNRVYAFDFDGTITTKDTLLEFIRYARGRFALYAGLLIFSPLLIMMMLRVYSNGKAKQRLFTFYFKGMDITDFDKLCERFAEDNRSLLRQQAIDSINRAICEGIKVLIVSASMENWVRPFFSGLLIEFICTKIEVEDGKLTGKFTTRNCYGAEKVSRIKEAFPNRDGYDLTAFGDSGGDKEMMEYADRGYYKPFK